MTRLSAPMIEVDLPPPQKQIARSHTFVWQPAHSDQTDAGVWLVRGLVEGLNQPTGAQLTFRLVNGTEVSFTALISKRGRMLDLVQLNSPIQAIVLSIRAEAGPTISCTLSLRKLGLLEYRYRQLRRVLPIYWKLDRSRRLRLGLKVGDAVVNLSTAYEIACKVRAGVYTQAYSGWLEEFYALNPRDRSAIAKQISLWQDGPRFLIVLLTTPESPASAVEDTYASLRAQSYSAYEVVEATDANWLHMTSRHRRQSSDASSASGHDFWIINLRAGVCLAEQALYLFADAALRTNASVIYTDEDVIDVDGAFARPTFKPDWSPEYLRATNYIGSAFCWRSDISLENVAWQLGSEEQSHSLLLEATSPKYGGDVIHIAAPLWHVPVAGSSTGESAADATATVVKTFMARSRILAKVFDTGVGRCRVAYDLPINLPLVSIIIPTRDGLNYLQPCVDSILAKTTYAALEVIIMDNQSSLPDTLAYFDTLQADARIRVVPFDQPFNYSSINNAAVQIAKGELVCLLNNDTEIITPGWLEEMVGLLLRDDVGAVGAKLLYADGTVQHAGDTVGPGGCANHLHTGIGEDDPGYAGRALVVQELSAVTAACLLTKKSIYQALGGLDEKNLPVAFNDVDFCLRIREAGYRVLWTPHAKLYHYESVSRGKDTTPQQLKRGRAELKYMRKRWAHVMDHDPFYNPNLSYLQPDFSLSATPRISRPWLNR